MFMSKPDFYLDGVLAKLNRADAHLEALKGEIPAFFDLDPYSFREKLDCRGGTYSLHIEVREQPPIQWSVLVGDIIHNIRSALDHLAWQLVLVSGGNPTRRTQFPIFLEEPVDGKPLARWKGMVAGINAPILENVRRVQPYTSGDKAHENGLAILNALSNEDKHRLPVASVTAVARHRAPGERGLVKIRDIEFINEPMIAVERPLKDGDKVIWANVRCTGPRPEIDVQGPISMHVAFRASSHHVPVQGLVEVFEHAQVVVGLFEALCREEL